MNPPLTPAQRERIDNTIRFLAVDAVQRAKSGHPGAPMGLARQAFQLWDAHLRFDPSDPDWPLRDRFVLSNGHASMLLYALLHLYGYDLTLDDVAAFRQLHSKTPGHPEFGDTPGVEVTTGPLGQGFAHGVGMALAARATRDRFPGEGGPGDHFVYGIVSDGDLMEGISSEAGSLAGHWRLGNLIYLYDDNEITIDVPTSLCFSEEVPRLFEAQGWHVQRLDGDDVEGLDAALQAARAETERPSLVCTRTVIGRGSAVAGSSKAHGAPLGPENIAAAKQDADWPAEPDLLVPDDVRAFFAERIAAKRAAREARDAKLESWRQSAPEVAGAWDAARRGALPEDLEALLSDGLADKADATRNHGKLVLERLAEAAPYLIGGSADLAGSNAPPILKGRGTVAAPEDGAGFYAGTNVHFGVREHAMGAITNGIVLDGTLRAYCGSFLQFSDYARPAIRLAALMGAPAIYVFTHDSIYLGEDGPTHQPVEHLDALRAIPNLPVFRPADGLETAAAWAFAARHESGPVLMALTRQKLPPLERPSGFQLSDVARGGYAVVEESQPKVVIVASGSEVSLACDTAEKLRAEKVPARVVSLPCLDLFLEQPRAWREALIPAEGVPVVAVEAARGQSLHQLTGSRGLVCGIDRFGASAPYAELAEFFGFTPDRLFARILEHLQELEA
ncbi:MAG: transketolase [Myxococcota bacterium]